jgi:hypothetical protein
LFSSIIGNLSSYLFYEIAKKKGIKVLLICDSRVGNLQMISESFTNNTYVDSAINYIKSNPNEESVKEACKKSETFIKEFQEKPFYYMRDSEAVDKYTQSVADKSYHFKFFKIKNIYKTINWFFKSFYDYYKDKSGERNDYSTINPWLETWDKIVRKTRIIRGYDDLYDKPDFDEDYAYLALHMEPESIFPYTAPFYTNQLWITGQLSRSLPLHYKLYIKDHPQMFGLRPRAYYKELKKIPNVKIIDPKISSLDLVGKCKLVSTITGTSGWEGILLKKPAIIFGESLYSSLSGTEVCKDITKLPYLVKDMLENYKYNHEELYYFIAGLFLESAPLDLVQLWDEEGAGMIEKKKKALEPFVDLIAIKLGLVNSKY